MTKNASGWVAKNQDGTVVYFASKPFKVYSVMGFWRAENNRPGIKDYTNGVSLRGQECHDILSEQLSWDDKEPKQVNVEFELITNNEK